MLKYKISKKSIAVQTDYWKTEHVRHQGGALASLLFVQAGRKNILASPMTSYIRRKEGAQYVYYDETCCAHLEMAAVAKGECVTVTTAGQYANAKGQTIPARFRRIYEYRPYGLVKVRLEMECLAPVDSVVEVGVASCRVDSRLNTVAYRPAPEMSHDPVNFSSCVWHEFSGTGSSYQDNGLTGGRYIPTYLGVMERGVEGLEWILGDDYQAFNSCLTGASGQSFCGVIPDYRARNFLIKVEPWSPKMRSAFES